MAASSRFEKVRAITYRLGMAAGLGVFAWQIWRGVQAARQTQAAPDLAAHMLPAFGLVFAAIGVQMLVWASMMAGLNIHARFLEVARGYMLSFLPRYIPGTVWGYLSRNEWLLREHQVSYNTSNLLTLLELGASITANLMIVALGFIWRESGVSRLLAIAVAAFPVMVWGGLQMGSRWQWARRLFAKLLPAELFLNLSLPRWLAGVALYLVHWFLYGGALSLVAQTLGGAAAADWLQCTAAYGLAWLVGFFILFAPAGLGFRETALTSLLGQYFHFDSLLSSLVAVFFRLMTLAGELAWVLVGLALRFLPERFPQTKKEN
jgi:hypothetical protein